MKASIENLRKIIEIEELKVVIIDNHLPRDLKWKKLRGDIIESAEKRGVKVSTAAEFLGEENNLLETKKMELYKNS